VASEPAPGFAIEPARSADLAALEELLRANGLPVEGFAENLGSARVARRAGEPVGCAAIEAYGTDALLRSVVTGRGERGAGLGQALVQAALALAKVHGARRVWLLTTTAEGFFSRIGFVRVERASLPESLSPSAELRGACPETAIAMRLDLP